MNNRHLIPKLKKTKKFFCQYCRSGFTRKDNLDRHQRNGCKLMIQPDETLTQITKSSIHLKNQKTDRQIGNVGLVEGILTKSQTQVTNSSIDDCKNNVNITHLLNFDNKRDNRDNCSPTTTDDQLPSFKEVVATMRKLEKDLEEKSILLEELKEKPSNVINNHNQVLQVVCISNNDNYLDMLTQEWGNYDRALEYIKDCALSHLVGDCKLIEKIYLDPERTEPAMRYVDKSRTRVEYFNEKKEKVINNKKLFGRKLANNLQNSYLKGVNYLIMKNLENHRCPNKFLEDYDIQTWNQHIYNLSDNRYQKKFINQLNIPFIAEIP